jgi:hypothetical protein
VNRTERRSLVDDREASMLIAYISEHARVDIDDLRKGWSLTLAHERDKVKENMRKFIREMQAKEMAAKSGVLNG